MATRKRVKPVKPQIPPPPDAGASAEELAAYFEKYGLEELETAGDLPKNVQKRVSRFPQVGATLLGRLGVDRAYKAALQARLGENPRLGEELLTDAQIKALQGATSTAGSALMVIDVYQPTAEDLAAGVRDPMPFYSQYGFSAFPGNDRRVLKTMRAIEAEYGIA